MCECFVLYIWEKWCSYKIVNVTHEKRTMHHLALLPAPEKTGVDYTSLYNSCSLFALEEFIFSISVQKCWSG